MLNLLFSIFTFPIKAFSLLESALTYKVTISEQTWLLEHENQAFEVMQTSENEAELIAYQELISLANDLTNSIIFQASLIGLFILALIIFCIAKPRLVLHPLMLVFFTACVIFVMHIYQQIAVLRIHAENLRYYFLLFTT